MNKIRIACECGAEFEVEHEMGDKYTGRYCVFCGSDDVDDEELDIPE